METPYTVLTHPWADQFDRDASYQNQRSHGTPDYLVIYTARGSGDIGSGKTEFSTRAGEIILYDSHTPQRYGTNRKLGEWHLFWAHFQPLPHWGPWVQWPQAAPGLRRLYVEDSRARHAVKTAFTDAARLCRQRHYDLMLNALERAFLWVHATRNQPLLDDRIRKAIDRITEEINEPFSLERLARHCSLSTSRLSHLFREQTGKSPQQYQEEIRLERAAQLLTSSSLSVSQVAGETGYANVFYFSNRFKKRFAISPAKYREG